MDIRNNFGNDCDFNMKLLKLLPMVGLFILVYIIYKTGIKNIYDTFLTANPYYILISFIVLLLSMFLLAFKWFVILKFQNINVGLWYIFKLYMIGVFYGTISPARSGSIIRASYLANKTNRPVGEYLSSILLERIMDLFVILIFSIIGCILLSKYLSNWLPAILVSFFIFLILSVFLFKKNLNKLFLQFIYKFLIPERFKEKSKEIYHAFYSNLLSIKKIIICLLLTIITWSFLGIYLFILSKAYSINISLFYMILILAITTVISLIPITVGGLGTREASLIFLFSLFNVPSVKAVSLSFLSLLISGVFIPLIGFLFSIKEPALKRLI